MNGHETGTLSDLALARKGAIYQAARGALVRRRRRRAALRASSAAGAAVLVIAGAAYLVTLARGGSATPAPAPTIADRGAAEPALPAPAPEKALPAVRIARITTDAAVLARTRVTADAPRLVRRIGDDELLAALEGTGEQYGIIRTGGRVAVVCRTCRAPDGSTPGWDTGEGAAPLPRRIRG